jgi:chromosome segregation ATPase
VAQTTAERQRRYIARLKAATARVRKLEAEVAKLKGNNASLRARITDLQAAAKRSPPAKPDLNNRITQLRQQNRELRERLRKTADTRSWRINP